MTIMSILQKGKGTDGQIQEKGESSIHIYNSLINIKWYSTLLIHDIINVYGAEATFPITFIYWQHLNKFAATVKFRFFSFEIK